ncbi:MAG: glycoside hydrolase family 3 C-terminal domain-containing protein [Oscillospiraceae bacterium]|jgi:beta-glucosidase|nr:glycoside hydrolase family 3 C-terminal domain-containing protein [Oscillospiraceae bacterium]
MKKNKIYPFRNPELSIKKRVADLISRLTASEKIGLLPARQQAIPRLGINEWGVGLEVARGYVGREPGEISTVFPQPVGLASTFNPALMRELGEIVGTEARIYHKKHPTGKLMMFGPTVDLLRDPHWGRNEESYGEDPFLAGEMSSAYCKGISGNSKFLRAIPILKHFCANNHEEDRVSDSADIEPRTLREYYYAAFEPAIKSGGAKAVMTAYNELSGQPAMVNPDLKNVCKKEWGMLFAVTDGADFSQNVLAHKHGLSHAETIAAAVKAGCNIMLDNYLTVIESAKAALGQGLMSEEELDVIIAETLTARFLLGEFESEKPFGDISDDKLDCEEHRAVNARAALECVTLMKNNGILPIKNNKKLKIAILGPLANSNYPDWYTGKCSYYKTILQGVKNAAKENVSFCDGCDIVAIKSLHNNKYLTVKNDGSVVADSAQIAAACKFKKIDWAGGIIYISETNGKLLYLQETYDDTISTAPVGYVAAAGDSTFEWWGRMIFTSYEHEGAVIFKGWRDKNLAVDENNRLCEVEDHAITSAKLFEETVVFDGVTESVKLAKEADYAVLCAGNDPMVVARECLDRKTLALPPMQQKLIDEVHKANKNAILIITASYPYSINKEKENLPAIIYSAHGGPETGDAIAGVLFGRYNPAGRIPQTWYKSERDLPAIGDYDITKGSTYLYFESEALFPFGHGLSYSSFEYSDFEVKDCGEEIEASLKVKNTSAVYGEEVVQLYFTALNPRVKRAKKQLCEFIRQGIEPGQTVNISFVFKKSRLRFWDVTRGKFAVETGRYRFCAASSSEDIRLTADIKIKGEKIPPRNLFKKTPAINYDDKRGVKMLWDREICRHYINAAADRAWNSMLDFYDVNLDNATGIEVNASMEIGSAKIKVFAGGKVVGEIEIPAAAKPTGFKKQKIKFKKPLKGNKMLSLGLGTGVNLLEFKLLK